MTSQSSAKYSDPKRSAMLHNNTGSGCVGHPNPPGAGCAQWPTRVRRGGRGGIIVLKSPIGDLSYKLFSDPTSQF